MSDAAEEWAAGVEAGSPGAAQVLRALAEMVDHEYRCDQGQDVIAAAAKVGERSVRRHLKTLEKAGLVERRPRPRVEGRGRAPDLLFLAVPPAFGRNEAHDQPATNRPLTGQFGRLVSGSARPHTAFPDPSQSQDLPPLGSPPKARITLGRWAPQPVPLDALPGPAYCDDWEAARQHPECRRVAGLVLDHASQRSTNPLTPTERNRLHPHLVEWLQAGYAPEALADAVANALAKTEPSVGLELRKRARPRSVGTDGVDAARRWIAGGTA